MLFLSIAFGQQQQHYLYRLYLTPPMIEPKPMSLARPKKKETPCVNFEHEFVDTLLLNKDTYGPIKHFGPLDPMEFAKIVEIFKKRFVNMPLLEALK